jgi:spermidine synthase
VKKSFFHCSFALDMTITHPAVVDGWFREIGPMWPGQAMTLKVDEILHHETSLYQDVLVFKSSDYGNVLVLDNVIQCTDRDEFSYQEMIAHLPLNSHPNPKRVLVIGGGDGGVLREVAKHDSVEEIVLCEIDEAVIRVSKQYLPEMAQGFEHPKVRVHVGDGFVFMKENTDAFDVIITDSSDPIGPAESLFQESYYELMKSALREGGLVCSQGECQWLHADLIKNVLQFAKKHYSTVQYAFTTIPTYPCGQIGFFICSKEAGVDLSVPRREWSDEEERKLGLRYYNRMVHRAAFVLPQFVRLALE